MTSITDYGSHRGDLTRLGVSARRRSEADTASRRLSLVGVTGYECSGREACVRGRRGDGTRRSGTHTHATRGGLFPVSQPELLPVASDDAQKTQRTRRNPEVLGTGCGSRFFSTFFFLFTFFTFFFFFFQYIYIFSLLRYQRRGKHTGSKRPAQSPNTAVQLKS